MRILLPETCSPYPIQTSAIFHLFETLSCFVA